MKNSQKIKLVGGVEFDCFSRYWRKHLCYLARPGVAKKVKRKYNKRVRHTAKQELRNYGI
jgi:hypothetical protein